MEKMMRRHWWKALGVGLVLYGIIAGMLLPLKPNIVEDDVLSANLNSIVTMNVVGYNTHFLGAGAGGMKVWLRAKPVPGSPEEFSIAATGIRVQDDRRATFTFDLPAYLPDTSLDKSNLSLVVQNPVDGFFVYKDAVAVRQPNPAATVQQARAPWLFSNIKKGQVTATPFVTFPFEILLQETIRNTYFHVSLWFAMMFVFLAAVVYAIKHLSRSRRASLEATDTISLRDKADYWSVSFTSVGLLFGVLGLLTGALWAKYTWDSWWSWDPKQTTTLIALLIYAGYFVLRSSFRDPEQRARISASYNVFAFACLIPLIYILPRYIGNSLHPGVEGNPGLSSADLDNTMRMVFYPIIIGWTLIGFWLATVTYRSRLLWERVVEERG